MNNEQKLMVMRGLTKTAIATLTANRSGPSMNQEAKPQIQAATDNVAMQNALSRGMRLIASVPPPQSNKARKTLSVPKTKMPKGMNTSQYGTGQMKLSSAEQKRVLVEALLQKQASPLRMGLRKGFEYIFPKTKKIIEDIATPPNMGVTGPVQSSIRESFKKGFREGTQLKPKRIETANARNSVIEQRRAVDKLNEMSDVTYAGGTPRAIGFRNRVPSANQMPQGILRQGPKPGKGDLATEPFVLVNPGKSTIPGPVIRSPQAEKIIGAEFRRSSQNLARNEMAQGVGRFFGTGVGKTRDAGKYLRANAGNIAKSTAKGLAGGAAAVGVGGGVAHYGMTGTFSGMPKTIGASYGMVPSAVGSAFKGNAPNFKAVSDAATAGLKVQGPVKDPRNLSAAQRKANAISDKAVEMSRRSGGDLKKANDLMRLSDSPKRFNDKWQLVDKQFIQGLSPEARRTREKMRAFTDSLKSTQQKQDRLLQSGGR